MRRFHSLSVLTCLLLASCGGRPEALPSQEVLKRAIIAGHGLESVDLAADVRIHGADGLRLVLTAGGTLRDGGVSLAASSSGTVSVQGLEMPAAFSGVLTLPGTGEAYFRIDTFDMPGGQELLKLCFADPSTALKRWWKAGSLRRSPTVRQTPDTRLIDAQLQALMVKEDLGIEESSDGYVYHYRVSSGSEALRELAVGTDTEYEDTTSAEGEIWIDANTFMLRRAIWSVTGVAALGDGGFISLDMRLLRHGKGGNLTLPQGEAENVPDDSVFATFFSGSLLP